MIFFLVHKRFPFNYHNSSAKSDFSSFDVTSLAEDDNVAVESTCELKKSQYISLFVFLN